RNAKTAHGFQRIQICWVFCYFRKTLDSNGPDLSIRCGKYKQTNRPLSGRHEQAIRWQGLGSTAFPVPIHREFLDWRTSPLAVAAEYVRARCQHEVELDLSEFIVVVPGGRAGRRLLEILVAQAEERSLILTPPEIVTPEKFPELLYQAKW